MKSSLLSCYCASLQRATRAITRIYDGALRSEGITINQFTVLELLTRAGTARIMDIEGFLAIDQTTLTRNLAAMAKEGWIYADVGEFDRRERHWKLTDSGKALYKRALPRWRQAQKLLERSGGASAMHALRSDLAALVDSIQK